LEYVLGLTWPQIYLLLDGAVANAPELEPPKKDTAPDAPGCPPEYAEDEEYSLMWKQLTQLMPFQPQITPDLIREKIEKRRAERALSEGGQ
jgi:hypothetical protein